MSPYPLSVMAAGNFINSGNDYARNRSFSALVVGGSWDKNTPAISDDKMWDDVADGAGSGGSSWRNPITTHSDFELPHLVAPAKFVSPVDAVSSTTFGAVGTSYAAPIVSGIAALMVERDLTNFQFWPEMMRASLIATSLQSLADQPFFVRLSYSALDGGTGGRLDTRQGAGLANAKHAYRIADSANFRAPGTTAASRGRYAMVLDFTSHFNAANVSTVTWNVAITEPGSSRLRVTIAWDGTSGSTGPTTIDGDLDLEVLNSSGSVTCQSTTYDSSWEACDLAVSNGETYTIRMSKHTVNSTGTYLGLAWYNYSTSDI